MNLNTYTQKSLEAVQSARDLAVSNGHQQMEQVHMLLALLRQENGLTAQLLDNGYMRFTLEYTCSAEMPCSVFNPPNGDVFMLHGRISSGERETQSFDIKEEDVRAVDSITTNFVRADDDRFFVFFKTSGI